MSPVTIQGLRKERGINQRELADAIGCSYQLISKIETGDRTLTDEHRKAIAKYFGVESDAIIQSVKREPVVDNTAIIREGSYHGFHCGRYIAYDALVEAHEAAVKNRDWRAAEELARILQIKEDAPPPEQKKQVRY